ncbi:MAG: DUF192 domain-containing protein [Candidatus Woesearchaeota archaeon]
MIKNKTKGIVVAHNLVWLKEHTSQARGLMFRKLPKGTAYVFPFHWPRRELISMLFVPMALDLIFLDKNNMVVELKESLKPWKLYAAKKPAHMLLEVAEGTIARTKTTFGDVLSISSTEDI